MFVHYPREQVHYQPPLRRPGRKRRREMLRRGRHSR